MSRLFRQAGGDWGSALIGAGRGLMDVWAERQAQKDALAEQERARAFQLQLRNAAWNREDQQQKSEADRIAEALGTMDQPAGQGTPGAGDGAAPASPTPAGPPLAYTPPPAPAAPVAGPPLATAAPDQPDASGEPQPPRMPPLRGLRSASEIAAVLNAYRQSPQYRLYERNSSIAGDAMVENLRARRKAKEEADARAQAQADAIREYQAAVAAGLVPESGLDGRNPPIPAPNTPEGVRHLVKIGRASCRERVSSPV